MQKPVLLNRDYSIKKLFLAYMDHQISNASHQINHFYIDLSIRNRKIKIGSLREEIKSVVIGKKVDIWSKCQNQ